MVYHGISRGCLTCKKRKKKCDETRPFCERCKKAKFACLGYQEEGDLIFRIDSYNSSRVGRPSHSTTEIPQCQQAFNHTVAVLHRIPSAWDSDAQEDHVLKVFLQNYCVTSCNPSISRGYLHGLENLLASAGRASNVAQAAKAVAYASLGNLSAEPHLHDIAKSTYSRVLESFRSTIHNISPSDISKALPTAILLGLYEIISASDAQPGSQSTHFKGISAILSIPDSPFDIRREAQVFQYEHPLQPKRSLEPEEGSRTSGILCTPISDFSVQSLDSLLVRTRPIMQKIETLVLGWSTMSTEELCEFRTEMAFLNQEYSQWADSQPEEYKPRVIGVVDQRATDLSGTIYWPGNVETYYDLYVAAVWNAYRKSYLLYLQRIFTLRAAEPHDDGPHIESAGHMLIRLQRTARALASDLAASVPFHLTVSPETAPSDSASGKPVGGLLLLHPLYVASTLPIVPQEFQLYFRNCLAWIGRTMGIGQATLLSKNPSGIRTEFIREGHMLVWAGMLSRPP